MESNIARTALLVMDMQSVILHSLPNAAAIKASVSKAVAFARDHKIPVIYCVVAFREGFPEISNNNKGFTAAKSRFAGISMEAMMQIDPAFAPAAGEVVVIKKRISAFTGSDLEVVLRSMEIRHLVLTGVSTSGVVLSTTREAADKDYQITIISNGCADSDEEVHRVLMTKIFPRQAEVMSVEEWAKG
jgi:nicotinamidase-related amidase